MTSNQPTLLRLAALALACGGFAACTPSHDKASSGAFTYPPPTPVLSLLGQTPVVGGPVNVRSGANVVMSGKDSAGSGDGDPIVAYAWVPQNDAARAITLIERSVNSASFIAPLPGPADPSPLVLQFGLTVTTARGLSATANATINVFRVPDPDNFILTDIRTSAQQLAFNVVAATTSSICGSASAGCAGALHADLPFTISVQKFVSYTTVQQTANTIKIGAPIVFNSSWRSYAGTTGAGTDPAAAAAATAASAFNNPTFRLRPPSVNIDEVNTAVLCNGKPPCTFPDANSGIRQNEMQIADVDSARAYYEFSFASPGNGVDAMPTPVLLVTPGAGGAAVLALGSGSGMALDVYETEIRDALRAPTNAIESLTSAQAYYAALDSQVPKTTLAAWLKDNCFDATAPYGADVKSTYVNNYDLGFGREMYFKTDCANPAARGATIQTANGERAAVVFNYPSLESAIQRNGAFAAVAMEYRADMPGTSEPYTRFYTFAPDQRSGAWVRVSSFDFDGRGQKYTPGNCTVCHGGKPRAAYTASGTSIADLGAVFLPWDERNLIFADSPAADVNPTLQAGFTHAEQAPNIQALNLKGTMSVLNNRAADTAALIARRQNQRDLICGFYGISAANCFTGVNYAAWKYTPGPFDPTFVPAGWTTPVSDPTSGVAFNAQDLKTMYLDVVTQHCRGCHTQRIAEPAPGPSAIQLAVAPQLAAASELFTPKPINSGISVYADIKSGVLFGRHLMPGSRLTADRFWAGFGAPADATCTLFMATTPACTLARLMGFADDAAAVPHPVAVIANLNPTAQPAVALDGTRSLFASTFDWALSYQSAGGYQSKATLVGDTGPSPAFLPDAPGYYTTRLSVTDSTGVVGPVDPANRPAALVIADAIPQPGTWSLTLPAYSTTEFDLLTVPGAGSATQSAATLGDEPNVFSITSDGGSGAASLVVALATCPAQLPAPYVPATYTGPTAVHCVSVDASSASVVPGTYAIGLALQDNYTAGTAAPGASPGTTVSSTVTITVQSAGQLKASDVPVTCNAYIAGSAYSCNFNLPVQCDVENQLASLPSGWYAVAQIDTNAWAPVNGRSIPGVAGPNVGTVTSNGALAALHITAGTPCSASVPVSYQPPSFFVSNQGGGQAAVTEKIPYQIQLFASNGTPLSTINQNAMDGTITVTVTRTTAFSLIAPALGALSCSGCHSGNADATVGKGWGLGDVNIYNELTDTQQFRGFNDPNGAPSCPLTQASPTEVDGTRCVDFSNPQHRSLILAKPSLDKSVITTLDHGGGDQSATYHPGIAAFDTVLRWINEGAYPD